MVDNLRLKKSNTFAFIEVFDEKSFIKNYEIVRAIVDLLADFKFRYNEKSSYLGDFFEELLNTSFKQEFGQFFTPYPLVDFMICSLPLKEKVEENIQKRKEVLPYFIDYACGSGHFLVSYIENLQKQIDIIKKNSNCSQEVKDKLNLPRFE